MFIRIVTWQSCLFVDLLNEKEKEAGDRAGWETGGTFEENLPGERVSVKRANLAE